MEYIKADNYKTKSQQQQLIYDQINNKTQKVLFINNKQTVFDFQLTFY